MNADAVVLQGVVRADGTLELEGKVPLPAGRVSVTLQPMATLEAAPSPARPAPRFGTMKGTIQIAPNFDDIPEGFEDAITKEKERP